MVTKTISMPFRRNQTHHPGGRGGDRKVKSRGPRRGVRIFVLLLLVLGASIYVHYRQYTQAVALRAEIDKLHQQEIERRVREFEQREEARLDLMEERLTDEALQRFSERDPALRERLRRRERQRQEARNRAEQLVRVDPPNESA